MYLHIKALHIIFVVAWFSALFYMPRLFVYYTEANTKSETDKIILQKQFIIMMKRLWYGIATPAAFLTVVLGGGLFFKQYDIPDWLTMKLFFVSGLYGYHFWLHYILQQILHNKNPYTAFAYRLINEIAIVLLTAIVFLVILKDTLNLLWGLAGLFILILLLFIAIKIYKRIRQCK